ncbi:histone-like nucleoid-structuring protein Lsr2 [Streptomyces sp. NPDC006992]|uniref:Lsr2 family DNA-binding protein n=1 Tax=Streptomyces sp. NPDC006992 TaxID=3155601 RepID=UPI0033CDA7C8
MTIAALRALLDAEQPDVIRPPAPKLPARSIHPRSKEKTQVNAYTAVIVSMHRDGYSDQQIADHLVVDLTEVTEAIDAHQAAGAEPETADAPEDQPAQREERVQPAASGDEELLAWAEQHQEAAVRRYAQQAREALAALRERRSVDAELEQIHSEASEIEQRLTALREREAQLKPRTKQQRTKRDYDPREVRTWARQHGFTVPDRGVIPKDVLTAWRERNAPSLRSVS